MSSFPSSSKKLKSKELVGECMCYLLLNSCATSRSCQSNDCGLARLPLPSPPIQTHPAAARRPQTRPRITNDSHFDRSIGLAALGSLAFAAAADPHSLTLRSETEIVLHF